MNNSQFQQNPYLWAVGVAASRYQPSELVNGRYRVIYPQVWQDTNPLELPLQPETIPTTAIAYLKLFPYRLHLPEVYGICTLEDTEVILLENAPLDDQGNLYPTLEEVWLQASGIRQLYWLWQIIELWTPLEKVGVASSLLVKNHLRVENWRIRLQELVIDSDLDSEAPNLVKLGESWESLVKNADYAIRPYLTDLVMALQSDELSLDDLSARLNQVIIRTSCQTTPSH
jgi:protein phosphatase